MELHVHVNTCTSKCTCTHAVSCISTERVGREKKTDVDLRKQACTDREGAWRFEES